MLSINRANTLLSFALDHIANSEDNSEMLYTILHKDFCMSNEEIESVGYEYCIPDPEPNICGRCGKTFTEVPAMSRIDNSPICPECGLKEALYAAGMSDEQQREIVDTVNKLKEKRRTP